MQELASPCPMARAAQDMEAHNILLLSPQGAVPHPAPRRWHHGGASPGGALLSAQMSSTPAQFCQCPFSYGAQHNRFPATQWASRKPTPGQGRGTATHARLGDVLPRGRTSTSSFQPAPQLSPQPQPPCLPAVRGFWLHAQNKSEEEEGPGTPDNQLAIKSFFWLTQKTQPDSAPVRSTLGSIQVVPRTPGPGEPWLHPIGFRSPFSGFKYGHPGKAAEQYPELPQ